MADDDRHPGGYLPPAGPGQALRRRAEDFARERAALSPADLEALSPKDPETMSSEEIRHTLHELRVHQIELEMQNEELRGAQAELDAARARYFDLYDLAPLGYCTLTEQGLILEANLTAAIQLGMARGVLVGQRMSRFILQADQDLYYAHQTQLFKSGNPQSCELRMVGADGGAFWAHLAATVAQDGDGAPVCRVVIGDVTERRLAEEALRQSEARLQATLDAIPDLLFEIGLDGRYRAYHPPRTDALAAPPDDFLGKLVSDMLPPDAAAVVGAALLEANESGHSSGKQIVLALPQGTTWSELSIARKATLPNEEPRFIVLSHDITERKQAEAAVQESEARLEQAFGASPIGMALVGLDGRFLKVNRAFCTMLGRTEAELLPAGFQAVTHPEDLTADLQLAAETIEGKRQTYQVEKRYMHKEGREVQAQLNVSLVRDADGAPLNFVSQVQDITGRKQAEAEIRALTEGLERRVRERTAELEIANKELESFSYSVSHDLRAPLRAISGFAAILSRRYRDNLDEKGRHYVDTIVESGEHMGILIEELLDYSRLGRTMVRAEPVPLGPLVSGLRAMLGERIAATGGTLEVVAPLAVPTGDPTLLERILANLVDNALTYRRPDVAPHVTLSSTRRPDGRVILAVADNGIGIPEEYRERIFEVFARLHSEDEYEGTGIGLAVARKAARLMGSDVTVESTEGEGSTFRLELPGARKRGARP